MANYEHTIDSPGNYGGDTVEQAAWPLFAKAKFPNYELFWQRFVVPRTDRPHSILFSPGVPFEDKEIASIHYSILHSFYVIYKWLSEKAADAPTEKQLFEYAYMKLSNICDLTEELLFKLLILNKKVGDSSPQIIKAVSDDAKNKIRAKIDNLTAKEALKKLKKTGTPSVVLLNRVSILDKFFHLKSYKKLSGDEKEGIRPYRNIVVHSWPSFQIVNMVPRPGYINNYQDWAIVTDVLQSNDSEAMQKILEHFVPMRELVQEQVDQLIAIVNQLWVGAIPHIPETSPATERAAEQPSPAGYSPPYIAASGTMMYKPGSVQKP